MSASRLISIDVGGTFTDILCVDAQGDRQSYKVPSGAPQDIAGLLEKTVGEIGLNDALLYSTTVALNSLIAGELPRIGLIVTMGFRDILETARLPESVAEVPPSQLPRRLVALEWVREVSARLEASGVERSPIVHKEITTLAQEYSALGIDVVAVALLHSYLDPAQENHIARIFAEVAPHITVVRSSKVLPELREYERTLATALNACLVPVLGAHLDGLRKNSGTSRQAIWLMQSSGGLMSAAGIAHQPLSTALSGPGAAVIGMRWLAQQSGFDNVITLDVGGTSTDVAVIKDGETKLTMSGKIAGFDLKTPMLDVLSIGAGGGSIAHDAADHRWHVGPASAGADPGPACYPGGGEVPTLTDAQLLLGRIPAGLLGGSIALDVERARTALSTLGATRNFDAIRTARGILEIASHNMCGAIRRVSVLRGHDPANYTLLAMGGAGPLHAAEIAELLGMRTVLVPPQPGLAAAWGLLVADVTSDFVKPLGVEHPQLDLGSLESTYAELHVRAARWAQSEALGPDACQLILKLDLRYAGMTHETSVECASDGDLSVRIASGVEAFHAYFEALTGRSWRDKEAVELVNLRITAIVERTKPSLLRPAPRHVAAIAYTDRAVGFLGHTDLIATPIYRRNELSSLSVLVGPAVIEQYESTTILPPRWHCRLDEFANLILTCDAESLRST
ncbi:MAG: hydantoinase/oxoprolinase family protein [Proteobacteria bacterium]|nr:hydantoinase/oxoprolinase family protein [Pseudomonadota bacterium]